MEFNSLIPELIVTDLDRSQSFYCGLLGFDIVYERPEERFIFLTHESAQIMLLQDTDSAHSRTGDLNQPRGQGINLSIKTEQLDQLARRLEAAGHPLRIPVRDQWHRQDKVLHGERQLWVMDPDGYLLRFVQPLGTRPVLKN